MIKSVGSVGFVFVILLACVGLYSSVVRFSSTVEYLADPEAARANAPVPITGFDERYFEHPYLTLVHVVSGAVFMILGPLQFVAAIRNRWLGMHRWCGRVFILASLVSGISALAIVPMLPIYGSFTARVATTLAGVLFLISILKGYWHVRRREIDLHREWMIRAFAIGLGISMFRALFPFFMIPPLRLPFSEAWDTVVWLGFAINILVAEVWINVTRAPTLAFSFRETLAEGRMRGDS